MSFAGACRLWMWVVVGRVRTPFVGGGASRPWAFVIRPWGLSSSVGGVVAAVPGRCLLWALGRRWWAPGHLVVGGRAVVRGRWLSLWVLGVRGRWVVVHGSWAVVCGQWGSYAVYVVRGWRVVVRGRNVRGRVVRALGCDLWGRWCRVMCSWLAKSDGTSGGRVLTVIHNLNNDERRHHRRSSFGCHVALGDVAPGNPPRR